MFDTAVPYHSNRNNNSINFHVITKCHNVISCLKARASGEDSIPIKGASTTFNKAQCFKK